ncbi:MAG: prepilin-type N-terminal cleavage/methylation domain-containing protein [Candidatus Pacebacteria bacterium]|nr:prepilin-type N-terminal cleavage/methylation domain-containing protein [Candidatus Paceibacterota bacterium]MCD8508176.1 prepilin-type N-terminal cleavage/methylation domain-containing protein [Candidatus Paceibacterota bacterium]MCD8528190.1 prepilin-type N-terminal cleavage/methylation domain-containing protein [Candidatus Paceibacterota bacterium]MCD8563461.1 prepilin-type N-terminal cleavage/methylation domain-containing protein [Candidatus Paceibacterota bacterium]
MHYSQSQSGFTLIEMLVAVLIFSLSLVALMTIASRTIGSNRSAQNEITAQFLAMEGIEVMRHIRDTNYVRGDTWDEVLNDCAGQDCFITISNNPIGSGYFYDVQTCNGICPNILYDQVSYRMSASSGDMTPFIRTLSVEYDSRTDFQDALMRITSEVRWQQGRVPRVTTMHLILADWQNPQP